MGSLGSTGISNTSEGWTLPKVTEGIPYSGLLRAKRKTNVTCRKGSYNLSSEVAGDHGEANGVWRLLHPADTKVTYRVTGTEDREGGKRQYRMGGGCALVYSRAHKF